jgi:hypothetical protein
MKSTETLTLSNTKYSFNILDSIKTDIQVGENHYRLPIESLFSMAARINKKRSFLFVSKLIGKHLPINPKLGLLTGALLAARYYESVHGEECPYKDEWLSSFLMSEPIFTKLSFISSQVNPLIIGFAETATALGHAFFDCFEKADYFHTTREVLYGRDPLITFEEEHSHATSHRCYIPEGMIANKREIILVDDELTTGRTALNIIRSIHAKFPRKEYSVVSILDWRSEDNKQEFAKLETLLGITIHVVSLLSGNVQVEQLKNIEHPEGSSPTASINVPVMEEIHLPEIFAEVQVPSVLTNQEINPVPFIGETGRFGINSALNEENQQKLKSIGKMLAERRSGAKTLCLGTGEFMYLPMKIAAEMGSGVFFQSSTRSPIFIQNRNGYGARYGLSFPNPEDFSIPHFIYNFACGDYDDVFLFFEREPDRANVLPLLTELEKTKIGSIKLIYFMKRQR